MVIFKCKYRNTIIKNKYIYLVNFLVNILHKSLQRGKSCNFSCVHKCDLIDRTAISFMKKIMRTIFSIFFLEFHVIFENASIVIGHCLTALTYEIQSTTVRPTMLQQQTLRVHSTPSLLRKSNLMIDNRVHTYTRSRLENPTLFQNG